MSSISTTYRQISDWNLSLLMLFILYNIIEMACPYYISIFFLFYSLSLSFSLVFILALCLQYDGGNKVRLRFIHTNILFSIFPYFWICFVSSSNIKYWSDNNINNDSGNNDDDNELWKKELRRRQKKMEHHTRIALIYMHFDILYIIET